jgi:hypothetical protein
LHGCAPAAWEHWAVSRRRDLPHSDDLDESISHYNRAFRHAYRLPPLQRAWIVSQEDFEDAWDEIAVVRANDVRDAPCAVLAKLALRVAPRYAIGILDGEGHAHVQAPIDGDRQAYRGHSVLLVNPIGGYDNWKAVARWIQTTGSEKARRAELAGLASERRPDYEAIDEMLREAGSEGPARVLPPDEGFSAARAAEVSFIYDVSIASLRSWKRAHRRELAGGKPGRPPNR